MLCKRWHSPHISKRFWFCCCFFYVREKHKTLLPPVYCRCNNWVSDTLYTTTYTCAGCTQLIRNTLLVTCIENFATETCCTHLRTVRLWSNSPYPVSLIFGIAECTCRAPRWPSTLGFKAAHKFSRKFGQRLKNVACDMRAQRTMGAISCTN